LRGEPGNGPTVMHVKKNLDTFPSLSRRC